MRQAQRGDDMVRLKKGGRCVPGGEKRHGCRCCWLQIWRPGLSSLVPLLPFSNPAEAIFFLLLWPSPLFPCFYFFSSLSRCLSLLPETFFAFLSAAPLLACSFHFLFLVASPYAPFLLFLFFRPSPVPFSRPFFSSFPCSRPPFSSS